MILDLDAAAMRIQARANARGRLCARAHQ